MNIDNNISNIVFSNINITSNEIINYINNINTSNNEYLNNIFDDINNLQISSNILADNILNNSNLFVHEIDNLDYKINDINE